MEVKEKAVAGIKDFVLNLNGSQFKNYDESIDCENAEIFVSGSSTLKMKKLNCSGTIKIRCVGASFVGIESLGCNKLEIYHSYASSMLLGNIFNCQEGLIDVSFSSRLDVTAGYIKTLRGAVTHTSFVRNIAKIDTLDVLVDGKHKAPHTDIFGSTYVNV